MKPDEIIFARVGWMKYYTGSRSDDERPTGGGSYNKVGRGSEICNFKDIGGTLYGFFSPPGGDRIENGIVNLGRILPGFGGDELSGVTVVFIAPDPTTDATPRERIIGWYRDATIFRVWRDDPTGLRWTVDAKGEKVGALYNAMASRENAVLLPSVLRTYPIPRGKGGMGQANVRYVYDDEGRFTTLNWIESALQYVDSYKGENLVTNPLAEFADAAQAELEIAAGYESNPQIRRAVEERAMKVAIDHYTRYGYIVRDKSQTESYDLLCESPDVKLLIEVKGTRADGRTISLTANEVKLATCNDSKMELCVVHSITVTSGRKPTASGGTLVRYENWNPKDHELSPVQYVCRLSSPLSESAMGAKR